MNFVYDMFARVCPAKEIRKSADERGKSFHLDETCALFTLAETNQIMELKIP